MNAKHVPLPELESAERIPRSSARPWVVVLGLALSVLLLALSPAIAGLVLPSSLPERAGADLEAPAHARPDPHAIGDCATSFVALLAKGVVLKPAFGLDEVRGLRSLCARPELQGGSDAQRELRARSPSAADLVAELGSSAAQCAPLLARLESRLVLTRGAPSAVLSSLERHALAGLLRSASRARAACVGGVRS